MGVRGELYSTKVSTGKRTFFFNVKENRVGDLFLNIVESSKREGDTEFARHQIMIFQEELIEFMHELQKAAAVVNKKTQIGNRERMSGQESGPKRRPSHPASGDGEKRKVVRKRPNAHAETTPPVARSSPSLAGAKTIRVKKKVTKEVQGSSDHSASPPKTDGG